MTHRARHGEVELKFDLDGDAANKVRLSALLSKADRRINSQRSIYFDTVDHQVHRAGYSLRVRDDGKSFTQTVKTNGGSAGLFDRGEWEAQVEQMSPDSKALRRTPLRKLKTLRSKVKPVVRSDVERTTWMVNLKGSNVEVALDSGTLRAGGRKAPLHELELELKRGRAAVLFEFAHILGATVHLELGVLSKEQRGMMLAEGAFLHEQKASAVDVGKTMDVGQVFVAIVHECVRHFRLNEALIIEQRDPRALHQARVAMRRLRTAFAVFAPAIRKSSGKRLRKQLRAFIDSLGDARNLDVFIEKHGRELQASHRRRVISGRAESYEEVIQTLKAQTSRDLLLNLVEWTVCGDWRGRASSGLIERFASRRLDTVWRKVRRDCSELCDLDDHSLHRLRISVKKLRYAIDFMAPLYAKRKVRKFGSALEEVQDCLGLIHDDMTSREIIDAFDLAEVDLASAKRRTLQLQATAEGFADLTRVGRFWAN